MEHNAARSEQKSGPYGAQQKDTTRGVGNASSTAAMSESVERVKEAIATAASDAMNSAGYDLQSLRQDFNSLKDTVTKFVTDASGEAAKSAREVTSHMAGQVSEVASGLADKGAEMAGAVSGQAKTFASELETMARRNPLGAIAGAVVVGLLIGSMGRRS